MTRLYAVFDYKRAFTHHIFPSEYSLINHVIKLKSAKYHRRKYIVFVQILKKKPSHWFLAYSLCNRTGNSY